MKKSKLSIIQHNTSFTQLLPQLVEVIVIVPATIIIGRFFCGWMCAFGAFEDFIYKISKNLFNIKYKINEDTDEALKYVKYVILAFRSLLYAPST